MCKKWELVQAGLSIVGGGKSEELLSMYMILQKILNYRNRKSTSMIEIPSLNIINPCMLLGIKFMVELVQFLAEESDY